MKTGMASSRTAFVSVSGVADLRVPSGLIRPAEVWPREVRFAHPCRARARHPIHKAMGGHASHGHTSGRDLLKYTGTSGRKVLKVILPLSHV